MTGGNLVGKWYAHPRGAYSKSYIRTWTCTPVNDMTCGNKFIMMNFFRGKKTVGIDSLN
jgi:hypothetical protein